jgi:hypothetical protein
MFLSEYIEFSFKLNDNDTIKKCLVITNYYDKNEIIIYELKRKIEFCLDRYTIDFCLPELDYNFQQNDIYILRINNNHYQAILISAI